MNRLNMRKKRAREPEAVAVYKYIHDNFKESRVELSYEVARERLAAELSDDSEDETEDLKRKSLNKPLKLQCWDSTQPAESVLGLCDFCAKRGVNFWFSRVVRVKNCYFFVCRQCSEQALLLEGFALVLTRKPDLTKVRLWLRHFHLTRCALCPCCQKKPVLDAYKASSWHKAHCVARARGGTNELENLLPTCVDCNTSMGTLSVQEYREQMGWGPTQVTVYQASCTDATITLLMNQ